MKKLRQTTRKNHLTDESSDEPTRIDLRGSRASRTIALPVAENNYGNLEVGQ